MHTKFQYIEKAVNYILINKENLSLEKIAKYIDLSVFEFNKLVRGWSGLSLDDFVHFVLSNHASKLSIKKTVVVVDKQQQQQCLVIRTHREAPEMYKKNGSQLLINYCYAISLFGNLLIASTDKGVCYIGFADKAALIDLQRRFSGANFVEKQDVFQGNVLQVYAQEIVSEPIDLHLFGTDFQLDVWESSLKVPMGDLTSYGGIANVIGRPKSFRAVGTAIGNNPVSLIIPCHRVIQKSGKVGDYMWGSSRKLAILAWESNK
jgi:AraC family transcriptional regulator of adaptative response/methylated-DNA-[protein]-cysteine methyltransferase